MFAEAGTVLVGLAALVTAAGTAAAAIITATRQGTRTRQQAEELHGQTAAKLEDNQRELVDRADRNHDSILAYMNGVNATIAALAEVSQLAVPFMADYRERHPDLPIKEGRQP